MTNLLPYCRKGRWGYVTRAGEVAVSPRFEWAGEFHDGLARVSSAGFVEESHEVIEKEAFAFIDESGELALPIRFDEACDVSEGLACVHVGASIGYAHYDGRYYVHGGLWGYVDRSGFQLPPQFDYARSFSEGFAAVKRGDTWTFIDHQGGLPSSCVA